MHTVQQHSLAWLLRKAPAGQLILGEIWVIFFSFFLSFLLSFFFPSDQISFPPDHFLCLVSTWLCCSLCWYNGGGSTGAQTGRDGRVGMVACSGSSSRLNGFNLLVYLRLSLTET